MYPEFMEGEDELIELFSLRYTDRGFVEAYSSYDESSLGFHLAGLYRSLFKTLSNVDKRSRLLKLANLSEDEFKEFDPLRAWIEVSLEYIARTDKDTLKLLDVIVTKLSSKRPDEPISWDEIKKSATDVKDFETSISILKRFFLLPYESTTLIRGRECPLLLEAYSDLRAKMRELLG
jgi:hypothetical protein